MTVDWRNASLQSDISYAMENGYAVLSRSTTGLTDSDLDEGQDMLDWGGIVVHAHGSNVSYQELNLVTSVGSIVSVRDVDGSWGLGSEFTMTDACCKLKTTKHDITYNCESWCTPVIAGAIADYGLRYPTLSYTKIRETMRATASNGGTWQEVTGYGTPDWDACETELIRLSSL